MELRLRYPPEPENAAAFAADIVEVTARVDGTILDFTPGSLGVVDRILGEFREGGASSELIGETIFGFGCYVGEVIRRNTTGDWIPLTDPVVDGMPDLDDFFMGPMLIRFGTAEVCDPIGRTFRRLDDGEAESVAFFYTAFAEPHERKL